MTCLAARVLCCRFGDAAFVPSCQSSVGIVQRHNAAVRCDKPSVRPFSSSADVEGQQLSTVALAEGEFHNLADATLGAIELGATPLEDHVDSFDLSNAMGVLTIRLGPKGTYVLNKQSPNRQIWWSSPLSGPRRYNYDSTSKRWVNKRDGHDMVDCLRAELRKLTGQDLDLG